MKAKNREERIRRMKPSQLHREILKLYPQLTGTQPAHEMTGAMALFEILRRDGRWCCLDIQSNYHYLWNVRLTPAFPHDAAVCVYDEALPVAICRAALLADLWIQEHAS